MNDVPNYEAILFGPYTGMWYAKIYREPAIPVA